jgi:drug/metabolite transporter (DMT)-like permease
MILQLQEVTSIVMMYPLIYPFLGFYFLNEKYSRSDFLFAFLGFIGTIILVRPGFIFGNTQSYSNLRY